MYSKTTNGVTVTVNPYFLDDQSSPNDNHYVWAYKVNIDNKGDDVLRLQQRTWIIIDGNGRVLQVQGDGVVGETPIIKPGETFEYTSGTPLKTTSGIMQGYYSMSADSGEKIKIDIPTFSLDSPYEKKKIH
ncbi:Co2+/Mg2+ efflux protein ApaG [Alphaproteobacteria bacterium]|nr:Co2+/Mg2+ efflux protein ApaG [Alphaproteobacteria bacterium]MDB9825036.1 Co2+/Mg2+ efflux protein ApaG [Alphaproteobacteria bacterium]